MTATTAAGLLRIQVLAALLLCGAVGLTAQASHTVSPRAYAAIPGNSWETLPLGIRTGRVQQIHGDLRSTPGMFRGLAFRRAALNSGGAPRTLTCTLLLADAAASLPSATFAANYAGAPVVVRPRGTIDLPDWRGSQGSPEPWTALLPFATPFAHRGTNDLLWELQIHASTDPLAYAADAAYDHQLGRFTSHGLGCQATGQFLRFSFGGLVHTTNHDRTLRLTLQARFGPANAAAAVLAGVQNPALVVPGLCERLFVQPVWIFPVRTDAAGAIEAGIVAVPYATGWIGATLFAQALALDPARAGLPFVLSIATESSVPPLSTLPPAPVHRVWHGASDVAPAGALDPFGGRGAIVRFTH
jgi:hypothetical protein